MRCESRKRSFLCMRQFYCSLGTVTHVAGIDEVADIQE